MRSVYWFLTWPMGGSGRLLASLLLGWLAWNGGTVKAIAQTFAQTSNPSPAPSELIQLLTQVDAAASQKDLERLMQFHGENFTHKDGYNRDGLERLLQKNWQRYSNLTYKTEILSWRKEGTTLIAETRTQITGVEKREDRTFTLTSTLRTRQWIENQKLVRQEVLMEHSDLTSGAKPPSVEFRLPERVNPGQSYTFDAIVQDPLTNEYEFLLGSVLDEPVQGTPDLDRSAVKLDALAAGGLFKIGRAPQIPQPRWISTVFVNQGGIRITTQRLQVTPPPSPTAR